MRKRAICFCVLAVAWATPSTSFAEVAVGSIPAGFDVSLSGSSNYSLPIKIAPGTAGTQPQIQLIYDSQTIGGPMGAGWSIGGVSAITRGPKDKFVDGVPGPIAFDNGGSMDLTQQDALYLDGQRLVPVRGPTGSGVDRRVEYRKANDDFTEIVQFGPDFAHSYFRARTKGGVTLIFGNSEIAASPTAPSKLDATIRLDNGSGPILVYAESAAIDTAGNFISFHYQSNGWGDYNISEINYTGHGRTNEKGVITVDRDPFASVSFVYENQASRPIELYVGGHLLRKDQRLTDIYSCVSEVTFRSPFSCKGATTGPNPPVHQTAHYKLDYSDTHTAGRFVLSAIHMFSAGDAHEVHPTKFTYSSANPGWDKAQIPLPDGLTLANTDQVAKGYKFVHFVPDPAGGLDILFAAQIGGKKVAYAFRNSGAGSWTNGGQPWGAASKNVDKSAPYDFEPPVPFVDELGGDLGVILGDLEGNGRTGILQSNVLAGQTSKSAYLAGSASFEAHSEFELPFVVSRDGKVVANYRFGHWTGGAGPDLLFESEGKKGLLANQGPGVGKGWKEMPGGYAPPIPLDARAHLLDLDCSGASPALIGVVQANGGAPEWKVYRFGLAGWDEETDIKWHPKFSPWTNPEAVREVHLDGPTSCLGLIVATAESGGEHKAMMPSRNGWQLLDGANAKTPKFDLVDAAGHPSKAIVANLKGDGYDGIVANTLLPDGSKIAFAFTFDSSGWHDSSAAFVPDAALDSDDLSHPVYAFVGPIVGQGWDDIAILNDQRVTAADDTGRNRQFGKFYVNDGTGFAVQTSFAPPIPFATLDKKDPGVRFIDLHGTGLPDAIFSRLVSKDGKTYLVSGAYRNTGHGWIPEPGLCSDPSKSFDTSDPNPPMKPGLCPPVPFAGADVTGNPAQMVDLDGDGFVDMVYSYRDKGGHIVTKFYFNKPDDQGGRAWIDAAADTNKFGKFIPSSTIAQVIFPLATSGIGDMGVRFVKFDTHRIGVLKSFREGAQQCSFVCFPTPGLLHQGAYVFDENNWIDAGSAYIPAVPFVTQYDSNTGPSIDLFVQILDFNGTGLPSIVANYQDPVTQNRTNVVWRNSGVGWVSSGTQLPYALDAVYWEAKTLVQIVDVNGDGLVDIVMTKGDVPSNSKTWLGTGTGWIESSNWQVPSDAISGKDGEPGYRLVDTKGDGYLDVLWMRPDRNGQPDRGLALNDGYGWSTRADTVVPKALVFADADGVDQGVRLISVSGKGLTDIVASFEGHLQEVNLNRGRRADILASVTDGYGITTTLSYETLLEYDCSDSKTDSECKGSASGVKRSPLGWRVYERETADAFPKISPVPTTYVVRQATIDQRDGLQPVTIDYRYGKYQVDADAVRSLGFAWRESLNEFSKILTRSEMLQDTRARPGVAVETTCVVDLPALSDMVERALTSADPKDRFPTNLCKRGDQPGFTWGYKISEKSTCWNVVEGDTQGNVNEIQLPSNSMCAKSGKSATIATPVIRQSAVWKSVFNSFEIDGHILSRGTDTFIYDADGTILDRHGNVLSTISTLDDDSSVETTNEYADDQSRWFLGRLTKSRVTKIGDPIDRGPRRKTEKRCSRFEYDTETGLVSAQEVNCESTKAVFTRIVRDVFGNTTAKSIFAPAQAIKTTRSEYDKFGRFESSIVDVLGHVTSATHDPATGQFLSAQDVNGLTTTFAYDDFGRPHRATSPTGIESVTDLFEPSALPKFDDLHDISWGLSAPVKYAARSKVGSLSPKWILYDAKGRQIRAVTDGYATDSTKTRYVFKETVYDSLGRVLKTSVPHDAADLDVRWTVSEYDALGRVCAATAINGLRTETLYSGRVEGGAIVTVVVDPKRQLTGLPPVGGGPPSMSCARSFPSSVYNQNGKSQRTSSTINVRKQMIESADALGKVRFEYDAGGRLQRKVGPTGAVTVNTYDELGNKVAVIDPDLGRWRYEFDSFGRLVKQVDAKGQVTMLEYDVASRPMRRVAGDVTTSWEYDGATHGIGKIASVINSNGYREDLYYDAFGRLTGDAVRIGEEQFFTANETDAYGRVTRVTYPNAFVVQNAYDNKGFLIRVFDGADSSKTYWAVKNIDVLGRVTEESFGNGVSTTKKYDPSDERIHNITAERAHERVLDLTVKYDLVGNLKSRKEVVASKSETFEYDALNRLEWRVDTDGEKSNFKYDAAGRITYKTGMGHYHYYDRPSETQEVYAKPFHAVLSTSSGWSARNYEYDQNGNMMSSPEGHLDYTSDNHVKRIYLNDSKWSSFDYGPSGGRFRQLSQIDKATQETLYVGLYERLVDYTYSLERSDFLHPTKINRFERLVRSRNYLTNGASVFGFVQADETYLTRPPFKGSRGKRTTVESWYLHADQLGSILRVTDQNGRIRERLWYDPWGARTVHQNDQPGPGEAQRLAGSWKRGFTGHEHLDAFSLIHMNGRVYSELLGVFLSADPVNQMIADTQGGNGYSYARNNPLRYIDPSGYDFFSDVGDALSGLGNAIGGLATSFWNGVSHFAGEVGKWWSENWRTVVVIVVVIVVTYFTLGAGSGVAITLGDAILAGAAAGAAGGAVGAALYGGSPDDIIEAALKGAVIGAISGAAFYGVGQAFGATAESGTASQAESMAAHGVVGGAKSAAEGGDFWKGFIASAATKATSLYGPDFNSFSANAARAAVVGGTVAAINGDKFANGAILGAFSYAFNDYLHSSTNSSNNLTLPSLGSSAVAPATSPSLCEGCSLSASVPTLGPYDQVSMGFDPSLSAPPPPTLSSVVSNAIGAPVPFDIPNRYLGAAQLQFLQNNPNLAMALGMGAAAGALYNLPNTPLQIPLSKEFTFGNFSVQPSVNLDAGTFGQPQNPFSNPKTQYNLGVKLSFP